MNKYETSTGHSFSTADWLNLHFEAAKPEYTQMVQHVGIQPGSEVLDAGCGNGRFIDVLDQEVGSKGRIVALDLAPENIEMVKERMRTQPYASEVTAVEGSVTTLPFERHSFDVVWCAAVTQYLQEQELVQSLKEFKRVLKPGGIVAIKEYDGSAAFFYPTGDVTLLWRSAEKMDPFDKERWLAHPLAMYDFVSQAGFAHVKQKTTLVERRAPLSPIEQQYIEEAIRTGQTSWSSLEKLSKKDQTQWEAILSEESKHYLLQQPNFYWREGHILTIGTT